MYVTRVYSIYVEEQLPVFIFGTYKADIPLFNCISIRAVLIINGNNTTCSIQICKNCENHDKLLAFGKARALLTWYRLRDR